MWNTARSYVEYAEIAGRYMRLLLERQLRVLALDSDVMVTTDPYPSLTRTFGGFQFITAFDTKARHM